MSNPDWKDWPVKDGSPNDIYFKPSIQIETREGFRAHVMAIHQFNTNYGLISGVPHLNRDGEGPDSLDIHEDDIRRFLGNHSWGANLSQFVRVPHKLIEFSPRCHILGSCTTRLLALQPVTVVAIIHVNGCLTEQQIEEDATHMSFAAWWSQDSFGMPNDEIIRRLGNVQWKDFAAVRGV